MTLEHLYNLLCAWEGNCNYGVKTNVLKKEKQLRPKKSGLEGGRVLNVLDLNNVMVNNGLYTSRHWGMLLWSDKRNWRDVLWRLNHSLSTLLSNALTPTNQPTDQSTTASHHQLDKRVGSMMVWWDLQRNFWGHLYNKAQSCGLFPASIRAVNDFPCNTEDVFPREREQCQMEGLV